MLKVVSFLFLTVFTTIHLAAGDDPLCPSGLGKCYQHLNTFVTWTDANTLCTQLNSKGTLVSISSAFENQAVRQAIAAASNSDNHPYIGAQLTNGWHWSDGTPFVYSNWAPGQPQGQCAQICKNTVSSDNCVAGAWRAVDCSSTSTFVCEWPTSTPGSTPSPPPMTTTTRNSFPVGNTTGWRDAASILLGAVNMSADPCNDFYAFTCGNWLASHPIPPGANRLGTYDLAQQAIDKGLSDRLGQIGQNDPNLSAAVKLASRAYTACMNSDNEEVLMAGVLYGILKGTVDFPMMQATQWTPPPTFSSTFWTTVGSYERNYNAPTLLMSLVTVDYKDVTKNALYVGQGTLFLPRDFYVRPTTFQQELNAYKSYLISTAQLFRGLIKSTVTDQQIINDVTDIFNYETLLAQKMLPDDQLRNFAAQYNVVGNDVLSNGGSFSKYFQAAIGATTTTSAVLNTVPAYINNVTVDATQNPRTAANYLQMRFLLSFSDFLGPDARRLKLEMKKVTEKVEDLPYDWQTCVETLSFLMPYAMGPDHGHQMPLSKATKWVLFRKGTDTGNLYVTSIGERDSVRADVAFMTDRIIDAFEQMVRGLPWMTPQSKFHASQKASGLIKNTGWPDFMLDNTQLDAYHNKYFTDVSTIPNNLGRAQLFFEYLHTLSKAFQETENFGLLGKPADRYNFLLTPATVNAWYQPERNSITFPYAAFNPPYYRYDFPQAWNFAGQGGTAGHELTHGFDDEGVQFYINGSLYTWMDQPSQSGFGNMATCVVNQYSNKCCPAQNEPVKCANGATTQGENIADIGGQQAGYLAYQSYINMNGEEPRLPGLEQFSMKQIFWIVYGYSWCMNQRDASLENQILTNPHAPAKCRTNQVMQDIPQFGMDFGCRKGIDAMYPNDNDRCRVWV